MAKQSAPEEVELDDGRTATERALEAAAAAIAARERSDSGETASVSAASVKRLFFERGPQGRRQLLAWGSAAAAVVLIVTISASLGIMRTMTGGTGAKTARSTSVTAPAAQAPSLAAENQTAQDSGASGGGSYGAAPSSAPAADSVASFYMVYGGNVYRHVGASDLQLSQVKPSGTARVSFESSAPLSARQVYVGSAKDTVYVANDQKRLESLVLVTRTYKGTTYVLKSADITQFDGWPTLPPGVPVPTATDGSPAFALDSTEPSGSPVYHRVGADPRLGIAIPPGTAADDPAAANPNWTWWVPAP